MLSKMMIKDEKDDCGIVLQLFGKKNCDVLNMFVMSRDEYEK
jgi:hypothetical protein